MDTEQRIKHVAKTLIFGQGKFDFRLSEISEVANLSHSILHYYFKTRRQLLLAIEDEMIGEFFLESKKWLRSDLPIKEKVELYVSTSFHRLSLYPFADLYIFNRLNNDKETFTVHLRNVFMEFVLEVREAIDLKIIKKYQDPLLFMINMISLTSYSFILAEVLYKNSILDQPQLVSLLDEQKQTIIRNLFD